MGRTRPILKACALLVAAAVIAFGHAAGAQASTTVNVRYLGAAGDGVTDDTAAVQRAMDVAAAGGGRVYFPAGTYLVGGLFQSSAVELYGDGDATLKSIDPLRAAIVYAKTTWTTGSIAGGSKSLRVENPVGARVGAPVAIRGAGQRISGQTTSDPYLYGKVLSILGNELSIDRSAFSSVTDATVWLGITKAAIRGLVFDGNKQDITAPGAVVPLDFRLTGGSVIANNVIKNGLHGAISFDLGSRGNLVENNQLVDNGRPAQRLGSAIWLFRGSSGNTIRGNRITGANYHGIAVDDRSEETTDWDASSNGNTISNNTINIPPVDWNAGVYVGGSSKNHVAYNAISGAQTGVIVDRSWQGANGRNAVRNRVKSNKFRYHTLAIYVSGSENGFSYNRVSSTHIRYLDHGRKNSFLW